MELPGGLHVPTAWQAVRLQSPQCYSAKETAIPHTAAIRLPSPTWTHDPCPCSNAELTKVIAKFPRILEYKSERTIRPRLEFLRRCGVSQEELAKVGWQPG